MPVESYLIVSPSEAHDFRLYSIIVVAYMIGPSSTLIAGVARAISDGEFMVCKMLDLQSPTSPQTDCCHSETDDVQKGLVVVFLLNSPGETPCLIMESIPLQTNRYVMKLFAQA